MKQKCRQTQLLHEQMLQVITNFANEQILQVIANFADELILQVITNLTTQTHFHNSLHHSILLCSDRYAEQVVPLLVQAQRKVEARINQVGGPSVPQPHYRMLTAQLGRLTTARDYLTARLVVHFDPSRSKLIQPGAQIDPMGHNTYAGQ